MTDEINKFAYSHGDAKPIYRQLADFIKANIQSGVWRPGDMIPPETAFCDAHKLSRTTTRLAFQELQNDGLIVRRRGLGSFVAEPKMRRTLNNLYSFSDDMAGQGRIPSSRVLEREIIPSGAELAAKLSLREGAKVFSLKRIRLADDAPILRETTFIPYALCPGIETVDFAGASLYACLAERYGMNPHRAVETLEAVALPEADAEYLASRRGDPAFLITRTAFLPDETVFEYTESITPGARCRFEIGLNGARRGITLQRGYTRDV